MWSVLSIIRITVFIVGFICYWRLEDQTLAIAQRAKKMNHEFDGHRDLVTQIKEIDHYYQSLSIEVDNRALNLTAVDCLSLPNHSTALSSSTECPEAVSNAWNWLEKAAKCLQTHLANAANYHKFFSRKSPPKQQSTKCFDAFKTAGHSAVSSEQTRRMH